MSLSPQASLPRLRFEGDGLVVVEFEPRVDEVTNARVGQLARAAKAARLTGVLDVVPTFSSVAFHVDPLRTNWTALTSWVEANWGRAQADAAPDLPLVEVPVSYGGEEGPDLQDVAGASGLSPDEVVGLHASNTYRVFMMGFVPGFAYLGVLPSVLRLPRRARPRTRVPAGSIAIAGELTGVYPSDTPGGWHLIGRTDVRPFDLAREAPFLFSVGQRVRFVPRRSRA